MTKNAQVRTSDAGHRQGFVVTPRAGVDIGTTAFGKICRTIAGRAQHTAHRKADNDQTNDDKPQQDNHGDRFTQGVLQGTCDKGANVAARHGKVLRPEHKVARVARTRHHQRENGDDSDKDHGTARNGARVERRVLT